MCCKCSVVLGDSDIVLLDDHQIYIHTSILTKFSSSPLTVGDHLDAVSTEGWSADTLAIVDAKSKAAALVEIRNIKQTSNRSHF